MQFLQYFQDFSRLVSPESLRILLRFSLSQLQAFNALACGTCPLLSRALRCRRRSPASFGETQKVRWKKLALVYVREEAALAQRQASGKVDPREWEWVEGHPNLTVTTVATWTWDGRTAGNGSPKVRMVGSESPNGWISSPSRFVQGLQTTTFLTTAGITQVGGSQHGTPCLEELRAFGIWQRSVEAGERQGGRQLGWCGANLG